MGGIAKAPALASSGGSGSPLAAFAVAGGVAVVVIVVAAGAWRAKRRGPIVMLLLVLTVPLLAEQGPSEAQAGPAATPAADTFTYDHENRLTQAVIGGVASSSTYNGDGLRMSHTVGGVTTYYTWDVARGLPVILQNGTNTYVYGLDLISTTDNAGAQTYHLYDGLGSTTDLVDGSGNSVASYGYDVFGAIRTHSGSSPNNYWLFTGEQRDSESDLYYLRARYYDPSIGRFLTRDPFRGWVASPQSQNPYAYVANNSTNWIDPSGLRIIMAGDQLGHPICLDQVAPDDKEGDNFDDDTHRISGGVGAEFGAGAASWGGCVGTGSLFDAGGMYWYEEGCLGGGIFLPPGVTADLIGEITFGAGAEGTSGASFKSQLCVHVGIGGCVGFGIGEGYFSISGGLGLGTPKISVMRGEINLRAVQKLVPW